ncbi:hypothetical protein [Streptomyces sp. NPDC058657]|uniref:hypothetical protein n=1 Tax=unclassified Streptomyces TaxID=2593676 RepID=UPI0036603E13
MRTVRPTSVDQQQRSCVLPGKAAMPLPLADELTEFLDRAAFLFQCPLYPPPQTLAPVPAPSQQSTTLDWMDVERRSAERWNPQKVRIAPDHLVRTGIERREVLSRRLAQLEARGRTPRVCLYSVSQGRPAPSFAASRTYATDQEWRTGPERCITDRLSTVSPLHRPGWRWVLHLIRAGHADGVVALAHTAISQHVAEYRHSLRMVEQHGGFVALVTPESMRPETVTLPSAAFHTRRTPCRIPDPGGSR